MSAKKGLGKGLDALIQQHPTIDGGVFEIDINKIEPNRTQPRKYFDDATISELASSIVDVGVLSPLLCSVLPDGRYELIAGERRWRAARAAKLKTVPIIVREHCESEILQIALIENIQREDLNPIEEAVAYKRLMDDYLFRAEDIAAKVGKSNSRISLSLSLLQLSNEAKDLVIAGKITVSVAKLLLAISDLSIQSKAAHEIADKGMTAVLAKKYIDSLLAPAVKSDSLNKSAGLTYIERELCQLFGSKVNIKDGKVKGKIEIEYYGNEDLERLISIMRTSQCP